MLVHNPYRESYSFFAASHGLPFQRLREESSPRACRGYGKVIPRPTAQLGDYGKVITRPAAQLDRLSLYFSETGNGPASV